MNYKVQLIKKLEERTAVIGVIGLGYVGLPLAVEAAKNGYNTLGFDINPSKIESVNNGINYIKDVPEEDLLQVLKRNMLSATTDFTKIKEVDCIIICVPTPLDKNKQPDMRYIKSTSEMISKHIKKGSIVILESTSYPGTTEDFVLPILEKELGIKCRNDFYLAYSPERVDPGNGEYKIKNTPKIIGGVGQDSGEIAYCFYKSIIKSEVKIISSPKVAEMTKLLENTFRNINIALVNEMAILCDRMNINIWDVIEAAKTKPYGFKAFYPGPGVGGHCIPLDPYYLVWKAKEYDYRIKTIETAAIINDSMPEFVINKTSRILNILNKPVNGSKVLVLGIAYKQDIDDYRESPAIKIIRMLEERGASVKYNDPYINSYEFMGKKYNSSELYITNISEADIIIICSMHSNYDYEYIQKNANAILDTKNAMKEVSNRKNIYLL